MPAFICENCHRDFSSRQRLNTHKNKANKCKLNIFELQNKLDIANTIDMNKKEDKNIWTNIKYQSDITLKLDKNTGNSCCIFGSSKSGKSTCLMHLYEKYYRKYISVLFSDSPQIELYKSKNLLISEDYEPNVIKRMHVINKKTSNKYNFCVLFDDMVTNKNDETLKKTVLIFRNSNISSIVSLQSTTLLNKQSRGSINNYLFFWYNSDESIKDVINKFLSGVIPGTMDQKIQKYREITKDHGFIYYNSKENIVSFHRLSL